MLSRRSCTVFVSVFLIIYVNHGVVGAKIRFLYGSEREAAFLQQNFQLSIPELKQSFDKAQENVQESQFRTEGDMDAIRIVDPPKFKKMHSDFQTQDQDTPNNLSNVNDESKNEIVLNYPLNRFERHQPSAAFLIQPENPHEKSFQGRKQTKYFPLNLAHDLSAAQRRDGVNYQNYQPTMIQLQQVYPFQVTAAVRHKEIIRTYPLSSSPYIKERVHTKKLKTFQSKVSQDSTDYEDETDLTHLSVLQRNGKSRLRRDASSRRKSSKQMRGSLLPVALTIMGENGELLTGRALLQHITVLLKNASAFELKDPDDELNKYTNGDVLLNEKDFHRIMDNSMNLTDPVMLTVLGLNPLNDSSLLTNTYVNEYLNCIDPSKIVNKFQALQTKIDCMKRKLFDSDNFDATGSSRYSLSNLPATLVYADVMSNIKNLVRPKSGIAFYSLPVDELTHLQQVVLPIEEYVSQIHSAHFAPRNYPNRKYFFNESIHPRMPVWYIVKPDGRIYQTEGNRNSHPATIYHGFPDIPNADVFVDRVSRGPFYEPVFNDE